MVNRTTDVITPLDYAIALATVINAVAKRHVADYVASCHASMAVVLYDHGDGFAGVVSFVYEDITDDIEASHKSDGTIYLPTKPMIVGTMHPLPEVGLDDALAMYTHSTALMLVNHYALVP